MKTLAHPATLLVLTLALPSCGSDKHSGSGRLPNPGHVCLGLFLSFNPTNWVPSHLHLSSSTIDVHRGSVRELKFWQFDWPDDHHGVVRWGPDQGDGLNPSRDGGQTHCATDVMVPYEVEMEVASLLALPCNVVCLQSLNGSNLEQLWTLLLLFAIVTELMKVPMKWPESRRLDSCMDDPNSGLGTSGFIRNRLLGAIGGALQVLECSSASVAATKLRMMAVTGGAARLTINGRLSKVWVPIVTGVSNFMSQWAFIWAPVSSSRSKGVVKLLGCFRTHFILGRTSPLPKPRKVGAEEVLWLTYIAKPSSPRLKGEQEI